jgi:hypothetical protein
MKYIKFQLSPGQTPPNDGKCLGLTIPNTNWLVWRGEDVDVFPSPVLTNDVMTAAEILSIQPETVLSTNSKTKILSLTNDPTLALLHAVILILIDQLNVLRNLQSLPAITKAQARTAINNKLDAGAYLNN